MKKQNTLYPMTTLDRFGAYELDLAANLLRAYADAGEGISNALPESFDDEGVYIDFNTQSGSVFLTNGYDALVLDDEHGLCKWYFSPYYGQEGILPELAIRLLEDDYRTDQPEDVEYLRDALRDDAAAFNAYAPAAHDPILKGMTRGEVFAKALAKCEEILAQTGQE